MAQLLFAGQMDQVKMPQSILNWARAKFILRTLLLLFSTIILAATAWERGAEYDEGYTVLVTAGTPRPDWPGAPFRVGDVRGIGEGPGTPARFAAALRVIDVHPPLYFWTAAAWRWLVGPDLFALRLLSVLYGVA